jgi:hypothetical protein
MTEHEWLTGRDPAALLASLRGRISDRKVRLFACAWCRDETAWWASPHRHLNLGPLARVGSWIGRGLQFAALLPLLGLARLCERSNYRHGASWIAAADELLAAARTALAVGERFADGAATEAERAAAYGPAADWAQGWSSYDVQLSYYAALAASAAAPADAIPGLMFAIDPYLSSPAGRRALARARARQASLLREIVGNPFRPVTVRESWRHADGGGVTRLAQEIYDGQRFCDLRRLATALRRAGCDDRALLAHCRAGGRHYRGCWALDLVRAVD